MWSLLKKHPRELSFTLLLAFYGGYAQTYVLSFFNEGIASDLSISNESISFAYSCATFLASLLLPYFGRMIDRKSSISMALLMGLLLMISSAIFANVNNFIILFVSYFCLRSIGQVAISLVGTTYIAKSFGKHRGKALSISSLGRAVAHGILPIIITFIISNYGWRSGAYFFALSILIIYIPAVTIFFKSIDESELYEESDLISSGLKGKTVGEIFKSKFIYLLSFGNIVIPFLMTGIFFQQGFFRDENGWSVGLWGSSFMGFATLQIGLSFFTGFIIDKFTARRLLPFVLLPFLLGVFLMNTLQGNYVCVLFLSLCGASVGLSANTRAAFMGECFDNQHLGFIKSIDSTFMVISTSIAPILFSYLYKYFGFNGLLAVNYLSILSGIIVFTYCSIVVKKY